MLKNNLRKFIVCILAIALLVLVMKTSFATDNSIDILNQLPSDNVQEIPEGQNTTPLAENTNLNTNTNQNTNVNSNVPTTTPYTGIGNNLSIAFVIIFAVSAIYAYKKIRDYNA